MRQAVSFVGEMRKERVRVLEKMNRKGELERIRDFGKNRDR